MKFSMYLLEMEIDPEYSIKSLTFTTVFIIVGFGVLCVFGVHPPVMTLF